MIRLGILVLFIFLGVGVYLQFGILVLYGLGALLLLLLDVSGFKKTTVVSDIKQPALSEKKTV